jgi:hypothetical protein
MTKLKQNYEVPKLRFMQIGQRIHYTVSYGGEVTCKNSTGIAIERNEVFESSKQRIKGNEDKNALLLDLQSRLNQVFYGLRLSKSAPITANLLRDFVAGKTDGFPKLLETYQRYYEHRAKDYNGGRIGKAYFQKIAVYKDVIGRFVETHYQTNDVPLESLKPIVGEHFEQFLTYVSIRL